MFQTRSETQNYDTSIANNINFPKWCTALAQKSFAQGGLLARIF